MAAADSLWHTPYPNVMGAGPMLMYDNVPKSGRLTAKKNWASSMQDHKAGSVDAYDALFKETGMTDDRKERTACLRPNWHGVAACWT